MSARVTIRKATVDDAPAITVLMLRALHEVNIRDYGRVLTAEQSKTWTVDGVVARMRSRITYVASEGDEIVGTAGFDGQQARSVFVRPDRHGLGIGSLLMRTIETVATERGLRRLSLPSSIHRASTSSSATGPCGMSSMAPSERSSWRKSSQSKGTNQV
jgi:GNAT superfamily N-acetyltransferase